MRQLLPTAVFAASDEMAFGAMLAIRQAGLRVPEDISVVGIDGHAYGETLGLTTFAQDPTAQGRGPRASCWGSWPGSPLCRGSSRHRSCSWSGRRPGLLPPDARSRPSCPPSCPPPQIEGDFSREGTGSA
ncbi:hypothetical protein GCM10025867_15390 [Frondihabitans sucicola]|uniref:Transcriptional regulator LacI/GalR-like sensor domain-containing protein n=1 Tax=Frondihabitans sucicola TaxID=1268041 RepID=A0ABM8GLL8_9MICO|nr:hypothetical protein GCM10025867_15390 [Frondihabitans sucicola]